MEFAEVRLYQPGDEIRTIDWNVTARTGRAAREALRRRARASRYMLMVDASASTIFGRLTQLKSTLAAELGALSRSRDHQQRQGRLIIFTDRIESSRSARGRARGTCCASSATSCP